jgi:signal transduction histidine kinase
LYGVIFLAILTPGSLLGWYSYHQLQDALTTMAMARRQAVAHASALALKEKLNALIDLGVSLGTRISLRNLVAEGEWDQAMTTLHRLFDQFPYIERLLLTTPDGRLMTNDPRVPNQRGRDLSTRPWYRGVSREWKPYLSDIHKASEPPPGFNTVSVAIPIRDEKGVPLAILVMQIRLQLFMDWSRDIFSSSSGAIYAVDRVGQTVAHFDMSPSEQIEDVSANPAVQRALRGEHGVIGYRGQGGTHVAAFEPVPNYGWAVVVQQPATEVFAARDDSLRTVLLVYGTILSLMLALAILITAMLRRLQMTQQSLVAHAEGLAALNQEHEAFSYSLSHDLRAPLRAIDGASQTMAEDLAAQLDTEHLHYVRSIRENAARMGQLVDDLLTFTRLTRLPLSTREVDMGALVRQVADEFRAEREGRDVALTIHPLPAAQGDPALLRQVWTALLSNALKFTRKRPKAVIEIGSVREGSKTVYFIRDNGVGFDMRYADKLFGVFQRLHHSDEFEGTGVGLAIVQRIIHRHGGRLWAEAEVDRGATFSFTLQTETP